jgi:putative glutamine amidotransferase
MSREPLVGITTSITVDQGPSQTDRQTPERAYVNSAYLHAVQQAGGVPVLLPPQLSKTSLERLVRGLDAVLLTGGGDVDPARFGEEPHPTLIEVAPSRDALETQVTLHAIEKKTPLLAICRGIQVLNVALGGSLHQDVVSEPGTEIQHSQKEARDQATHKITVTPRSRLGRVLGAEDLEVNSFHHQVIKSLGRGLVPVAWAPDQLIEAVELDDDSRWVVGVQWHPEHLVGNSEPARRLFSALVTAARA